MVDADELDGFVGGGDVLMTDNKKLIEEARDVVRSWDMKGSWSADSPVGMLARMADALEAAEEALIPADNEREALAVIELAHRAMDEAWPGSDLREEHERLDRLADGFRRSVVPEPSAERSQEDRREAAHDLRDVGRDEAAVEVCAWCPATARGSAWHNDGRLHPSCGRIDHGQGWVPDEPPDAPIVQFNARKGGKSQVLIESMLAQANERGVRVEVIYPQGEPTDAEVKAALSAWFRRMIAGGRDDTHEQRMRAALRAALPSPRIKESPIQRAVARTLMLLTHGVGPTSDAPAFPSGRAPSPSRERTMAEFTEQQIRDLAEGLRDAASTDDDPQGTPAEAWQQITRHALGRAEIELTNEQFERAWRTAWRRVFMGGNYTLDARAILAAAQGENQETNR